ncbi:hypothetical protein SDC9_129249 [bioreactor metagenome]|uniref:Uncharacterized protein n=1 Tax=bioreactor metagenome TaxID=1076179 RepID=A0A645CZA6_9ZZZZ
MSMAFGLRGLHWEWTREINGICSGIYRVDLINSGKYLIYATNWKLLSSFVTIPGTKALVPVKDILMG